MNETETNIIIDLTNKIPNLFEIMVCNVLSIVILFALYKIYKWISHILNRMYRFWKWKRKWVKRENLSTFGLEEITEEVNENVELESNKPETKELWLKFESLKKKMEEDAFFLNQ